VPFSGRFLGACFSSSPVLRNYVFPFLPAYLPAFWYNPPGSQWTFLVTGLSALGMDVINQADLCLSLTLSMPGMMDPMPLHLSFGMEWTRIHDTFCLEYAGPVAAYDGACSSWITPEAFVLGPRWPIGFVVSCCLPLAA